MERRGRKRKYLTEQERRAAELQSKRKHQSQKVNLGSSLEDWRAQKVACGIISDSDFARHLLSLHQCSGPIELTRWVYALVSLYNGMVLFYREFYIECPVTRIDTPCGRYSIGKLVRIIKCNSKQLNGTNCHLKLALQLGSLALAHLNPPHIHLGTH